MEPLDGALELGPTSRAFPRTSPGHLHLTPHFGLVHLQFDRQPASGSPLARPNQPTASPRSCAVYRRRSSSIASAGVSVCVCAVCPYLASRPPPESRNRLATTKTATDSEPDPDPTPSTQPDTARRSFAAVDLPAKSSAPLDSGHGPSASSRSRRLVDEALLAGEPTPRDTQDSFAGSIDGDTQDPDFADAQGHPQSPPPRYPTSEASASTLASLVSYRTAPPPFSSLFVATSPLQQPDAAAQDLLDAALAHAEHLDRETTAPREDSSAPAYEPSVASGSAHPSTAFHDTVQETKRALPQDSKGEPSSRAKDEDAEPPPAYEEGYSPLQSFTYVMAAAGGASSIITQVQQGGSPINTLGGEKLIGGANSLGEPHGTPLLTMQL